MGKDFVVKEAGRETMVYDAERDELHVLNATAQIIYRLSREGRGIAEIEAELRSTFHAPQGKDLRPEIESCLREFQARGLVDRTDPVSES